MQAKWEFEGGRMILERVGSEFTLTIHVAELTIPVVVPWDGVLALARSSDNEDRHGVPALFEVGGYAEYSDLSHWEIVKILQTEEVFPWYDRVYRIEFPEGRLMWTRASSMRKLKGGEAHAERFADEQRNAKLRRKDAASDWRGH